MQGKIKYRRYKTFILKFIANIALCLVQIEYFFCPRKGIHYVIKFVSDLLQVSGFLRVVREPVLSSNKTDNNDIYNTWNVVESGIKHHNPNLWRE